MFINVFNGMEKLLNIYELYIKYIRSEKALPLSSMFIKMGTIFK